MYISSIDNYRTVLCAKAIYLVGRDGGKRLNVCEATGLSTSSMLVRCLYVSGRQIHPIDYRGVIRQRSRQFVSNASMMEKKYWLRNEWFELYETIPFHPITQTRTTQQVGR